MIWHFRLRFEFVLRDFKHMLVFIWNQAFWSSRAAIVLVFYRCTSEVLLMGLVVEFVGFHDHLLLVSFDHAGIWCGRRLVLLGTCFGLLLKHKLLTLLIHLICPFRR